MMMKRALILSLLAVGVAYGQSGVFNLPYEPQPRIVIPYVEPHFYAGMTASVFSVTSTNLTPQYGHITNVVGGVTSLFSIVTGCVYQVSTFSVTNSSPVENPYSRLKFCDFILKAVDQKSATTGAVSPVLYIYSSIEDLNLPIADTNAAVFYQNTSLPWPDRTQRIQLFHTPVTNFWYETVVTNVPGYTDWNLVVSPSNAPSFVSINGVRVYRSAVYNQFTDDISYNDGENLLLCRSFASFTYAGRPVLPGQWRSYINGGISVVTNFLGTHGTAFITAPLETNSIVTQTNSVLHSSVLMAGSILSSSSNSACAVEIYPDRRGRPWMKKGNPDIKWMVLLSNGIDFYRDAQSGEPVWFDCAVEWVNRIPEEGKW